VKLQKEIITDNFKLLVIIEGKDAAGTDDTIKRIVKHLSPRETKDFALGKPIDPEQQEWYLERYISHLSLSGKFVLFNRSRYNRPEVEKVMGFCTGKQYKSFFTEVKLFEKSLIESGFIIIKYYLYISKKEQAKRFKDRKENPVKQWKIRTKSLYHMTMT
jgi:polyphosphate kinase 2 (PPK2 family)